jgi:8-oxo-dGTP pyrophosphatase MutT (NUDIX family)
VSTEEQRVEVGQVRESEGAAERVEVIERYAKDPARWVMLPVVGDRVPGAYFVAVVLSRWPVVVGHKTDHVELLEWRDSLDGSERVNVVAFGRYPMWRVLFSMPPHHGAADQCTEEDVLRRWPVVVAPAPEHLRGTKPAVGQVRWHQDRDARVVVVSGDHTVGFWVREVGDTTLSGRVEPAGLMRTWPIAITSAVVEKGQTRESLDGSEQIVVDGRVDPAGDWEILDDHGPSLRLRTLSDRDVLHRWPVVVKTREKDKPVDVQAPSVNPKPAPGQIWDMRPACGQREEVIDRVASNGEVRFMDGTHALPEAMAKCKCIGVETGHGRVMVGERWLDHANDGTPLLVEVTGVETTGTGTCIAVRYERDRSHGLVNADEWHDRDLFNWQRVVPDEAGSKIDREAIGRVVHGSNVGVPKWEECLPGYRDHCSYVGERVLRRFARAWADETERTENDRLRLTLSIRDETIRKLDESLEMIRSVAPSFFPRSRKIADGVQDLLIRLRKANEEKEALRSAVEAEIGAARAVAPGYLDRGGPLCEGVATMLRDIQVTLDEVKAQRATIADLEAHRDELDVMLVEAVEEIVRVRGFLKAKPNDSTGWTASERMSERARLYWQRADLQRAGTRLLERARKAEAALAHCPRMAVGILVRRRGHLLLGQRLSPDGAGAWSTPGGWIEPGETPREAAVRELREETGIEVSPADLYDLVFCTFAAADPDHAPPLPAVVLFWFSVDLDPHVEAHVREPEKCAVWSWRQPLDWPMPLSRGTQSLIHHIGASAWWIGRGERR